MTQIKIEPFNIVGISVRTDNNNGKGSEDISKLWQQFISESVLDKIPNKVDNTIYCIYTEYDGDYTHPYTAILGCKVNKLDSIPHGLVAKQFGYGSFNKYVATGNIFAGSVFNKWQEIWNLDISRAYTYDFEVYGDKAINPENAEVEIFIAVK